MLFKYEPDINYYKLNFSQNSHLSINNKAASYFQINAKYLIFPFNNFPLQPMMQNRSHLQTINRTHITQIQMNGQSRINLKPNANQSNSDILFKGLKRKISQRQYSKIKNSYKISRKDVIQKTCSNENSNIGKTGKLRLSIVSNQILNQKQVYEEVLKMKERNHFFQEENTELLRKIRKQQKIQEIYRKKMQGRQLTQLTYQKALQIKLLLQVEDLQNCLQERENKLINLQKQLRAKRNDSLTTNLLFDKKLQLYSMLINNEEQFEYIYGQKQAICQQQDIMFQKLREKALKQRQLKSQKKQQLSAINKLIKSKKQSLNFKQVEMKKKESNSSIIKSGGAASSITVKNRNNIQEIENEIQKIKEQYQMLSQSIQTQMDHKIRRKIILHKQISQLQESQKKLKWNKIKVNPLTKLNLNI